MSNPEIPVSRDPLDELTEKYGLYFTPMEREELLKRLEERAQETAEDDYPASQP
jgi:hypothetical protein